MGIIVISVCAVAFAVMGVGALIAPARVTIQFGIPDLNRDGRNEVRAVYGGFGLAVSGTLVWAMVTPDVLIGVCVTVAFALLGMALGRVISTLLDRGISKVALLYLIFELVGAAALWSGSAG